MPIKWQVIHNYYDGMMKCQIPKATSSFYKDNLTNAFYSKKKMDKTLCLLEIAT